MEKKILTPILIAICLVGCDIKTTSSISIKTSSEINVTLNHDYSEISFYRISWHEFFEIDLDEYFVYFFQRTCSHCESFKNTIIEEALNRGNIFFIEDSDETRLTNDASYTIGLSEVDEFAILGFPSMIKIVDHIITKNVAGVSQIKSLLFS